MTREEMIEQLENTILLIRQNGKDWWDERDIPILEAAIKAMQKEITLEDVEAYCKPRNLVVVTKELFDEMQSAYSTIISLCKV